MSKHKDMLSFFIIGCIVSFKATSGTMGSASSPSHLWSAIGSLGYTHYQSMYSNDGQTPVGRLALARELFLKEPLNLGLELGVQNGNTMRLNVSQTLLDELGGLPIQSTIKPLLDLLLTAKIKVTNTDLFFGELKGGIAYRQWQFDNRSSVNNLSNIAGEVQAGIGYCLSQQTTLSLVYQGIYGGNPHFVTDTFNETGSVSTLPIQQGILLSLSHAL